nr:ribonuclease H-like domain-containing protein [Tanacetum cinerariifolium]
MGCHREWQFFQTSTSNHSKSDGTSTSTIPGLVTTKEKAHKKNDVKARSMLLMALPNEHLLTFSQYKDAKTFFEAIQARFGGNDATKKTQRTLLKQMYENFNAANTESIESIFNRLQKIISQLAILGENISQEDLNMKFLRSLPSDIQVSVVSTPVNIVSSHNNTANLSDATVYDFLANQPNGSQLMHEDLEQIHEDDLEEMYLKWQLALLSMRARRYFQRTGKKIAINGSDTAGYDKTKVECFNCHKMGHFARECRSPRYQESRPKNEDSSRKTVNVEDTSSKAVVAIDEAGFDWSYMADDEVPTNMALMAFSDSEVQNSKTCSNTCLKSFETLKTQYNNLRIEFNKSEFDLATYKRGLASVEEQLVFSKKNEVVFCDQIVVLKRDASFRDSEITALNLQIEKLKKKIESNQIKIENASKSLDKLIGSQITDNNITWLGFTSYNAIAPPPTGLFSPLTIDLSKSGLKKFQHPEFKGYGPKDNWVSDSNEDESEEMVLKSDNVQHKPEQANQPRKVSQNSRNNTTNWNEMSTQKLGVGFQFTKKACFVCGRFSHLIKDCDFHDKKMVQKPVLKNVEKGTVQREDRPVWNNAMRTNHQNFSNSRRNFTPTAVLTQSGIVPIRTARQSSSRAAAPVSVARPINTAASKPLKFEYNVNTAKENSVNTAKGYKVTSAAGNQRINAVKSSTCWGAPQDALKDQGYFDNGRSKHMTGNISYLTDFKEHDVGYVAFGGGGKGCKITGKGTIRTAKLDFEDVYFVKELQFNLFSVSQMCDKKNNVLFTNTECFVLSPNFKLADESQVLLKVPRKNNMYSFDMKNIVPQKDLTCLLAKATNDESML